MKTTEEEPKKQNGDQLKRFREKARDLGCDENEAAFEDRLREIAKSPPQPAKRDKDKAPE